MAGKENKNQNQNYNFYAVAKGKQIAIFTNWFQCRDSTNGISGNSFKGFVKLGSAIRYMERYGIPNPQVQDGQNLYTDAEEYKKIYKAANLIRQKTAQNTETEVKMLERTDQFVQDVGEAGNNGRCEGMVNIESDCDAEYEYEDYDDGESMPASQDDRLAAVDTSGTHPLCTDMDSNSLDTDITLLKELARQDSVAKQDSNAQDENKMVDKCIKCELQHSESHMIECDICKKWVHYKCSGIPAYVLATYEEMGDDVQKKEQQTNHKISSIPYRCQKCVNIPRDLVQYEYRFGLNETYMSGYTQSQKNGKKETNTPTRYPDETLKQIVTMLDNLQTGVIGMLSKNIEEKHAIETEALRTKLRETEKKIG